MNNSKLTENQNTLEEEQPADTAPMLRARQERTAKIIEALDAMSQSNFWKILQNELFLPRLDSAVNQLCVEKDNQARDQLQGKIEILSKYSDFKALSDAYRLELQNIDGKLKGR